VGQKFSKKWVNIFQKKQNDSPDKESSIQPSFNFNLKYTFAESQIQTLTFMTQEFL